MNNEQQTDKTEKTDAAADAPPTGAGQAGSETTAAADAPQTDQAAPAAGDGPKVPDAQPGDPEPVVQRAEAQPVLQSIEQGREELAANPARGSVLTDHGNLVRE